MPPPKNSVRSWLFAVIVVRMLTTVGDAAFAMLRKVSTLSAPVTGALFIAGTAMVCAADEGARSSRDAMIIPTNRDAVMASST